jgi:hypothetical protein
MLPRNQIDRVLPHVPIIGLVAAILFANAGMLLA